MNTIRAVTWGGPVKHALIWARANSTLNSPFVLETRHSEFKAQESTRPPFNHLSPITVVQAPNPEWKYGDGANSDTNSEKSHVEIDPHVPGRSMLSNYKLLIAGIPRPISFISTQSSGGVANLAPFSYFQVVDHDPPIFVVGFSARESRPKDTLRNLEQTKECVINVVSESMIEAVNAASIDVPYGVSEWALSGLHQESSTTVKANRVKEAVFSIEGVVKQVINLDYHRKGQEGKPTGALAVIEATRFWVREDAIIGDGEGIDLGVLRPLVQLGGISYGRIKESFELPRKSFASEMNRSSGLEDFIGARINAQSQK